MEFIKRINFMNILKEVKENVMNLKTKERIVADYNIYYLNFKDLFENGMKLFLISSLAVVAFYKNIFLIILCIPVSLIYPFFIKNISILPAIKFSWNGTQGITGAWKGRNETVGNMKNTKRESVQFYECFYVFLKGCHPDSSNKSSLL